MTTLLSRRQVDQNRSLCLRKVDLVATIDNTARAFVIESIALGQCLIEFYKYACRVLADVEVLS